MIVESELHDVVNGEGSFERVDRGNPETRLAEPNETDLLKSSPFNLLVAFPHNAADGCESR